MSCEGGEDTLCSETSRGKEEKKCKWKRKSEMNFFGAAPVSFVTKNCL